MSENRRILQSYAIFQWNDNEELSMMVKIVDKMTKDLDLSMYHDGYKERIEALIKSKMTGEVAQVKE